ncbi:MAG: hypothetical protein JWM59_2627 [Verrucomicrobiales bacterium]|nr:hypothetical protein [Verrucomicrobiales bacterium]
MISCIRAFWVPSLLPSFLLITAGPGVRADAVNYDKTVTVFQEKGSLVSGIITVGAALVQAD